MDSGTGRKKPGPKPKNPLAQSTPGRGRPPKEVIPLKKRLHALAKYLLDYTVSVSFTLCRVYHF